MKSRMEYISKDNTPAGLCCTTLQRNGVQVFPSSHNEECLNALKAAAKEWESEVSFIRTLGNGAHAKVEQYHASTIFGAMEIGEIR